MLNRLYNLMRNRRGNVFILVLIISFVAIMSITAMIRFMLRDIESVELDEGELVALNMAEAGLSDWYMKFDRFSSGVDPSFRFDASYNEDVYEDGNLLGSFAVDYSPDIELEWKYTPFGYSIVSKGTDAVSGMERTVRVRLISLNLYDFIFSEEAMGSAQIAGNTNITGPLFVVGDFGMITGDSLFREGPLFVLGDIIISGSSQIGDPDWPILLFMGGKMYEDSKYPGGPEFDPVNPPINVEIYVAEFHNVMIDITLPNIDSEYLDYVRNLGALEVLGDLFIGNGVITLNGADAKSIFSGYLDFDSNGVLNINGNIIVNGNVDIGQSSGRKYTIMYNGHSNIIATGSINAYTRTIPEQWYDFPEFSLLTLISQQNITLEMTRAQGGSGENDPNLAAMIICNNQIELSEGAVLTGSSLSNGLLLGLNSKIFYRYGIGEFLGPAVPQFNDLLFIYSWQEVVNDISSSS